MEKVEKSCKSKPQEAPYHKWSNICWSLAKNYWNIKNKLFIYILVELILSLAGSNSAAEHSFRMLTNIWTNRCLKISHSTLGNLILIRYNDSIWLDYEWSEIIQQAADIHLAKQRKLRVDGEETNNKRRKVTEDLDSEDEEESDYTSTEEAHSSFDED